MTKAKKKKKCSHFRPNNGRKTMADILSELGSSKKEEQIKVEGTVLEGRLKIPKGPNSHVRPKVPKEFDLPEGKKIIVPLLQTGGFDWNNAQVQN